MSHGLGMLAAFLPFHSWSRRHQQRAFKSSAFLRQGLAGHRELSCVRQTVMCGFCARVCEGSWPRRMDLLRTLWGWGQVPPAGEMPWIVTYSRECADLLDPFSSRHNKGWELPSLGFLP